MIEIFRELFNGYSFMPHGHCYLWSPGIVWLHVLSDALIVLAYYSIPLTLVSFVRQRKDLTFSWMFVCFAVFILACGTTHLMEIWNVWHSNYLLSGGVKALTAAASVPTAILLARLVPSALALASPEQLRKANVALQEEIGTRRQAEEQVRQLNRELESRVLERTAELQVVNRELQHEISERQIADEALRANEADFRASFYSSAVGQAQVNPATGRYLRVNAKFCQIAGYSEQDLLGMTFRDLTHPEDRVDDGTAHERMVRGELTELDREKRYLRKDGKTVWVSVNASIIRDAAGRPLRTLAVVQDITEARRAEAALRASEEHLRLITNLVPHGIFAKDASGRYLFVNRALAEGCGMSIEEVLKKNDFDLVSDRAQAAAYRADDLAVIESGVARFIPEEPNTDMTGRTRIFQTTKVPFTVAETGEPAVLGVSVDITDRKRAEEEVRRLNAELENRVAQRTAELEAANKELEAFSYSVSHDLRAPLRAVDGFSQALLEDYGAQLPEGGQRYLRTIRRGAQTMGMLIDDLLAFSRLSRAPLNTREVNVQQLVGATLDELAGQIQGRQVDIRLSELPPCQGDPALLKQVWINLLSNAFKYTRQRESAVVEIGFDPNLAGGSFYVRDNGAGFDMRYVDKLFGVFQRLHRAEEFEGTGVGLAIVQRIVQRHGGRVWAEAAVDRGATFHFTLQEENKS